MSQVIDKEKQTLHGGIFTNEALLNKLPLKKIATSEQPPNEFIEGRLWFTEDNKLNFSFKVGENIYIVNLLKPIVRVDTTDTFTTLANTTTYTLTKASEAKTAHELLVVLGGVIQLAITNYTYDVATHAITFTEAPKEGTPLSVRYMSETQEFI